MKTLAMVAVVGAALYGQCTATDIDGWGKIKWGMSIADAASAYSVKNAPEVNEYWTNLEIGSVDIGNITMAASVGVRQGRKDITLVRLWSRDTLSFDTLKTLLIQKYNAPVSNETGIEFGDRVTTITWVLPSTSIELRKDGVGVSIAYIAIDKKASDAL